MFHRSYDLSCVSDIHERTCIQNAINGVNNACSDTVDAWLYVAQGLLFGDMNRALGDYDYIPKTVFGAMNIDNHSGASFQITIQVLQAIAQDYDGWRIATEQENSRREDATNFWSIWKNMKLLPYYRTMAGGGSRASIGPILENFLSIKASRNDNSDEVSKIEQEVMAHLGQDLEQQVDILTQIVSLEPSMYCSSLLVSLKKRLAQKVSMEQHNEILVKDAITQLSAAIESRNPVALKASLNPGWYSVKFHSSELYKNASDLLSQLS
jgi:hypothetical protein